MPDHSATSDILDSPVYFFFPVPPVVTRPASGTCIHHVLTKFPEKVVSFGIGFLPLCWIIAFSYCIRPPPPPPVDRFVSYKDVNRVNADFLSYQLGLLDWGALYDPPDVDLQVSLLIDFVNHLYRVCVPVRWKFVPDPRYPSRTLEIRDAA
jgi:hypothetical protein